MILLQYLGWLGLLVLSGYQLVRVARDTRELLSPRAVVIFGLFFVYVVSYVALDEFSSVHLLSVEGYSALLVLAVASCALFLFGFHIGWTHRSRRIVTQLKSRNAEVFALLLAAIGLGGWWMFIALSGGFVAFYSLVHGAAGVWEDTSAYLYELRLFMFPALFVLYVLWWHGRLSAIGVTVLLSLGTYVLVQAWWLGNRGDFIRLIIIGILPSLIGSRAGSIARRAAAPTVVLVVALVLILPYLRVASHFDTEYTIGDALEELRAAEHIPLAGSVAGEGNELVVAAGVVQSARETGTVDFGIGWLYALFNFVPRALWSSKPSYGEWSVNVTELVVQYAGWEIAGGSAMTGLADMFLRFWWVSPLLWLPLGIWGGRLYRRTMESQDIISSGLLVAYLIGLVYLIVQDFKAGFYGWLFFAVGVAGAKIFCTSNCQSMDLVASGRKSEKKEAQR